MEKTRRARIKPDNRSSKPAKVSLTSNKQQANSNLATSSPANDNEKMMEARMENAAQQGAILDAISGLKAESLARHKEVIDGIAHIRSDLEVIKGRMTTAERRISDTEDLTTQLTAKVSDLETKVKQLTEKNDDLENRSRRSNLRLIGLEEKAEGDDAESFLENWLPEVLGAENFPIPVRIERAHRIPASSSGSSSAQTTTYPRPLIAKFLNFKDKVRVMNAARKKNKVMFNNRQVKFFSDFSTEVQRQRKAYNAVKQTLHSKGIQYGLQYPAKLRVKYRGKDIIFHAPKDVDEFLHGIDNDSVSEWNIANGAHSKVLVLLYAHYLV